MFLLAISAKALGAIASNPSALTIHFFRTRPAWDWCRIIIGH